MNNIRLHGAAVRVIRERTGISHGDMADYLGISRGYLTNLEKDRKNASWPLIAKIARRLGVEIKDITYPVPPDEGVSEPEVA